MAISVTHTFVSPVADAGNPDEVGPNEWNAAHTISGLGTAAEADSTDFATAAQGALADTAVQPAAIANMLETSDIGVTVQAHSAVLDATTASFTTAQETKLGHISATQAVDLDAIETRVNALDAAVVLKGSWDASAGTFPGGGTAQAGDSYIVSVAGTVNSVAFALNDRIIAIADNASTTTFAANWFKADYTDQVLSVAGKTGAVTLVAADISDLTATATELNYTDGVTSAIQTQLDGKQASDADLTSWAGVTRASGFDTFVATPSSANLRGLLTDETGSGAAVFGTSPSITTPTIAGTDGAPAPLTASLADTTSVVASAAKMWNPTYFGNAGTAVVHKFNRVMVGEATVGSTDLPMSTPDWLETLVPSSTQYSQFVSVSATGNLGITGAARTSDFRTWAGSTSGGSQGVTGFGWNDDLTAATTPIAVGAEFRGFRKATCVGLTLGAQISAANEGSTVDIDPSTGVASGSTTALLLTNGPGPTGYVNPISAGLAFGADSGAFMRKGLVFFDDALDTSLGGGAAGIAVELARSQSMRWLNSGGTVDAEFWGNASGLNIAASTTNLGTNLANYYTISGSAGTQPILSVDGADAGIDIMMQAKGAGTVIARKLDTATNSVTITQQLRHSLSSGTAAAGIGVGQNFVIVNASAVNKIIATQEAVTTDATNGTEDADLVWKLMAGGAAAAEKFRIKSTGAPIFKPPATPETLTVNGDVTLSLTSNTNLRISARGSDGTTRVANITLA